MSQLHDLAVSMKVRVRRDECGDPVIQGKRGNIHEDGQGFSVFVTMKTRKGLRVALENLAGLAGQVRQRGDTEAVLHVSQLPGSEAAQALRVVLPVRKVREVSPEEAARLRAMSAAMRPKESA